MTVPTDIDQKGTPNKLRNSIKADLYNRAWAVVEIDFQRYFDSIPHHKLLILIRERVRDGSMLRIIKQSLKVGVAHEAKVEPRRIGVPQGSPISPLYSNIYLNLLDRVWHSRNYPEKLGATPEGVTTILKTITNNS